MELNNKLRVCINKTINTGGKNYVLACIIFILLLGATFINDTYLRVIFSEYTSVLRLLDHYLAGFGVPTILFLLLGSFYRQCKFYLSWCLLWEGYQYFQRWHFQFDQYAYDILGIATAILVYRWLVGED